MRIRGQRGDGPAATPNVRSRAPTTQHWWVEVRGLTRRAIRSELGARFAKTALGQLPSAAGWQLVLFDVEGYSHAEIAGILKNPEEPYDRKCFTRVAVSHAAADWKEQTR